MVMSLMTLSVWLSPMSRLGLFVIFLFSFLPVNHAQNTTNSNLNILKPLHPSVAVVIGIISIMISLTFLILAYAKFCHRYRINFTDRLQDFRSVSRFSGIDQTVINSLPFFTFSSLQGSKEGFECSVCISTFEDNDILRLLPNCKHAFHKNCIDQWLESHSSCPLCRYKLDPKDLESFTFSNRLRYPQNPLIPDSNGLEIFIQREQDHHHQGSSRFNDKGKEEELLIQQQSHGNERHILHKFKHRIIVSDVVTKNRWSDVNSSDLLTLNSEMLGVMSSNRFSPLDSKSARFYNYFSVNGNIEKIKEDIERKRLYESRISKVDDVPSTSDNDQENSTKILNYPGEKRSVSEITIFSRFRQLSTKNRIKGSSSSTPPRSSIGREERIRQFWLPIARRTVQWFSGQETIVPQSNV